MDVVGPQPYAHDAHEQASRRARPTMSSPSPADAPMVRPSELADALRRIGTIVLFGVLPVAALVTMLAVGLSDDSLSADFHHEIYPQAKEMLGGHNPYPPPDFDPTAGANY